MAILGRGLRPGVVIAEHSDLGERLGASGITLRELLVHRIEEYARHCGHADLLREYGTAASVSDPAGNR